MSDHPLLPVFGKYKIDRQGLVVQTKIKGDNHIVNLYKKKAHR